MKKSIILFILTLGLICSTCQLSSAAPLGVWDGWTQFAAEDLEGNFDSVDPGFGGQDFDAEYLYYKYDAIDETLSIGLQSGFNLIDGMVTHNSVNYYGGDLALSFDDFTGYNYGVDFGFSYQQCGYSGSTTADLAAGIYSVSEWNEDVYSDYSISSPFAINSGAVLGANFLTIASGSGISSTGPSLTSYYQQVSFKVSNIVADTTDFSFNAHWTMSCGNDAIDGTATIPEPTTLLLMFAGFIGLAGFCRTRNGFIKK